jgi:predicted DNA-binding WGR domain protein
MTPSCGTKIVCSSQFVRHARKWTKPDKFCICSIAAQGQKLRRRPKFEGAVWMNAVHLRRIDQSRNLRRFYLLDVQRDLFGHVLLVKTWGRIGAHGRIVAELYDDETLATNALTLQASRKRRRGYRDVP